MQQYIEIIQRICLDGTEHKDRTGVGTKRLWGHMSSFDLAKGFPLLTTKKMAVRASFVELLGFLRGITDNQWYVDRGCKIWTANAEAWNAPRSGRDGHDPNEMGKVYGYQWRNFNGVDQLQDVYKALLDRSNSRRLIISAWNPPEIPQMCLPPCHIAYHFCIEENRLNIAMWQRSCDTGLGVPFNWANTALFCHIMAHCTGLKPGRMVWFGDDVHIYNNHFEQLAEQISRVPFPLPTLNIEAPSTIKPWELEFGHIKLINYYHHDAIKMDMVV